MKLQKRITTIVLVSAFLVLIISAKTDVKIKVKVLEYDSIEKLIDDNKIHVEIKGLGGHTESCVGFDIENKTSDTIRMLLEAGRRLCSKDSTIQDILIVKNRTIVLVPYEQINISGYGFCCQSDHGSPRKVSEFNIGYMAPPEWVKLANVIDKNNFPASAVQHAIWVLSNNHELSSIRSDDMQSIKLLRQTVADIKGIEIPWYTLTYEKDTTRLFSHKAERIIGKFDYYLKTNGVLTINIRNKRGQLISTLIKESMAERGMHSYNLNLLVKGWAKGDYEIFVYENYSNLSTKKKFRL